MVKDDEDEIDLLDHSVEVTNSRKGNSHIYRFQKSDPKSPLRTQTNYMEDLKNKTNGVKGPCVLSYLKYFFPCDSTCIDSMHSILEGVVKKFFRLWFESPISLFIIH